MLLQSMLFGSPPFIQDAGVAALTGSQAPTEAMRAAYQRRARVVIDALADVRRHRYARARGRHVRDGRLRATGLPALEWALGLLESRRRVGDADRGLRPVGRGHVRIGLVAGEERLAEACRRIASYQASLVAAQTTSA